MLRKPAREATVEDEPRQTRRQPEGRVPQHRNKQQCRNDAFMGGLIGGALGGAIGNILNR